jgi:hypothetical protein
MVDRMKKRPKRKPKGLRSDGSSLPSTVAPIALSGQYINHARAGRLEDIRRLRKELGKLLLDQEKNAADLKDCNDRDWLDKFAATVHRRSRNFASALRDLIGTLEKKKRKIEDRVKAIRQKLEALDPSLVGQPIDTLAAIPSELSPSYGTKIPKVGPNANFDVSRRDEIIYNNRQLSSMEICKQLDFELMQRNASTLGLPEEWHQEFGVSTFVAAYNVSRCRPRVQTLISKARTGT